MNVALLGLGVGTSSLYKLNGSIVLDDDTQDTMTGDGGQDWFLGNFAGGGTKDSIDRGLLEIALDV